MKTIKATRLVTWLLLGLGAPAMAAEVSEATPAAVVATVNGSDITEEMLQMMGMQMSRNPGAQQVSREDALDQLINIELVAQDAEKHNIDKRPNVIKQLEAQRRMLLVNVSMREYLTTHPVTDEELKKLYDERMKNHDGNEYKAQHILVDSEDTAKAIIAELGKGGDFAKLATEKSKDPSGKQNGGDLGWFSGDQMVKPFAEAVAKMKKGETTKKPVQTQFGWHVIRLEDTRKTQPPSFDSMKEQLQGYAQSQRVEAYVQDLRKGAKIDIKKAAAK
ncbi:MAG: peptidylprolyl isomerase [Gammaproteobacteria bacterium]|nr:peptidylprolyl isomerase [Gammaproteobacteria bacterium]